MAELEAEKSKWFGSTQLNFFILLPVALLEPARVGFNFSTIQNPLKYRSLKATQRSKRSEYTIRKSGKHTTRNWCHIEFTLNLGCYS